MTTSQRNELKEEVGQFVTDAVINDVDNLKSPVTGRRFKGLDPDYAAKKRKLGKPGVPNLQLRENMLPTHRFKPYREGVEVGIFARKQALKADNHNKFSPESMKTAVPKRQFVPKEDQKYRPDIQKQIKKINKDFRKRLGLKVNQLDY